MKKKKVTINIDPKIYTEFQKFCDDHAYVVSKKIEILLKEVMKDEK